MSRKAFTRSQIELFLRLEHMEKAGVPILQALAAARDDAPHPAFRSALEGMILSVRAGHPLHEAMQFYPRLFDETSINLVALGEKAGRLGSVFEKCREHFRRKAEHAEKMRKATRNPKMSAVIIIALAVYQHETLLPQIVALGIFFYVALVLGRKFSPVVKYATDQLILQTPRVGKLVAQDSLARFSESLATLYESGIPLRQAIDASCLSVPNLVIRRQVAAAGARVANGESLYRSFGQEAHMDSLALGMIKAGEDTGNLSHTMRELSGYYERATADALTAVQQLSGPLLTLITGYIMWFGI